MLCRECGLDKTKIRSDRKPDGRYIYVDEAGNRWRKGYCPECRSAESTTWNRLYGFLPRKESPKHRTVVGFNSEKRVIDHISLYGIKVGDTTLLASDLKLLHQSTSTGPDLVYSHPSFPNGLSIEVKTVFKKKDKNSWYVAKVYPLRKKDDFVAIVFENKIVFDNMGSHLLSVSKCGTRTVTHLYR